MLQTAGSLFLLFSGPIVIIALLSVAFLIISGKEELHEYVYFLVGRYYIYWLLFTCPSTHTFRFSIASSHYLQSSTTWIFTGFLLCNMNCVCRKKTSKNPSFHLWTFPVLVDGPFGVVSAAEFIGILLFVVYVVWAVCSYTVHILSSMSDDLTFKVKRYIALFKIGALWIFLFW